MESVSIPLLLKLASVFFAVVAVWPSVSARNLSNDGVSSEDRRRRRYLLSYALTSVSILLFCAIGLLQ